ncbi:MAG: CRISPR-associated protein Csx27 [Dysgonamonadaceae bacterium]
MQKFSLYDILTVLFPGVIFLFILDKIRLLSGCFLTYNLTSQWDVIILLSVFLGASVYVLSFSLTAPKFLWFYTVLKLYQPVSDLFYQCSFPRAVVQLLNRRSIKWYERELFPTKEVFISLSEDDRKEICDLQDEYYDRMYYELDYERRLDKAITFQSFYLFFRNLVIVSFGGLLLLVCVTFWNLISLSNGITEDVVFLFVVLMLLAFLSVWIARWYRRRMVHKMYWYFYSHINAKQKI